MGVNAPLTGNSLAEVNQLLNATIDQFTNDLGPDADVQVDMWTLLNWVYVVQYWTLLYDVGQFQPTLYPAGPGFLPATFTPTVYSDTNNIFVNETLFKVYGDYFTSTILPLLGYGDQYSFQDLDSSTNSLETIDVSFFQIYSCTQTQLKEPLSLIISVIVADNTFLQPALALIILFGTWYQTKKSPKDGTFNWLRPLTVANWCEGCVLAKDSEKGDCSEKGLGTVTTTKMD